MHQILVLAVLLLALHGHSFPFACDNHKATNQLLARDVVVANTSANATTTVPLQTTPLVKGVCSSVAGLGILLAVVTYWILIRYAAPLSNGIPLPWHAIEERAANILLALSIRNLVAELEEYNPGGKERFPRLVVRDITMSNGIRMLNLDDWRTIKIPSESGEEPVTNEIKARQAQGLKEAAKGNKRLRPTEGMVWMDVGSSALKSLVQLAIWETISLWLGCLMVINTVVYSGFSTGNKSPDGNLRLFATGPFHLFYGFA